MPRGKGVVQERGTEAGFSRIGKMVIVMAVLVALASSVAVAKTINGTNGPNRLSGTNKGDYISCKGGNDRINGRGGMDRVLAGGADKVNGSFGNDVILGGPGGDTLVGDLDNDEAYGNAGSDTILVEGDSGEDFVNCGEDANGADRDVARVDENDAVDNTQASTLVSSQGLSCEEVFVGGTKLPEAPTPTPTNPPTTP